MVGRLFKQPAESRLYDFEFSGKMRPAETISAVVSVTSTPSGLTVGSTSFSGTIAQVRLSGGTNQTEYTQTCTVTTNQGNTLEMDGRLWIDSEVSLTVLELAALDELIVLAQADTCPVLDYSTSVSELSVLLSRYKRGSLWALSTAFQIGDKVIPTAGNRNGRRYKAVEFTATASDRMTGATEPSWPTSREGRVTDNHVVWQEDGTDWNGQLWDLVGAARAAWLVKAAKASPTSDFATDSMEIKSSQLYQHCREMANSFAPVFCL